jgi:membrane fusion protein (multidrug efflux system)
MKQKTRRLLQNIGVIILIALGLCWIGYRFMGFTSTTFTDNARTKCRIVPVVSRIQGFIKEVRVDDYQQVHKGDTLVIIEDAEFRLRLAQAEADLQNALSGKSAMNSSISTTRNNLSVTDASLAEIEALMNNAKRDYERYKTLLEQEAVTQQQFDAVATNYEALKAKYESMSRSKRSTALVSEEQTHRLGQSDAGIEVAKAAIDLARLNLSYTVITAPCDGYTSKVDIKEGQLAQPGQTLLTVVDESDIWVVANYKETQTSNLAAGDTIVMTVDAIKGVKYYGVIDAMSQATGAQYSVIPQDNATGNFVKVEQRVPIKIRFTSKNRPEDMKKLRAGLNVECKKKK